MSNDTTIRWLKVAGILLILIGIPFSWATAGALSAVNIAFLDLVFLPFDGAQSYAAQEARLLSAIAGGLTAGIGVAIYLLASEIFTTNPAAGRRIVMGMMITWFIVDSIGSVIAGAWFNVVPNVIIFVGVTFPLLRQPQTAAA